MQGTAANNPACVYLFIQYVFIEYLFCARHVLQQESANLSLMDETDLLSVLVNKVLFGTQLYPFVYVFSVATCEL